MVGLLGGVLVGGAPDLVAQTDYYNTDRGRPVRIEDAHPVERHAFELQLAPVRLERLSGGIYNWEFEPEIAYGILPSTHVELGFPILFVDAGGTTGVRGLSGIGVSALHNLNVETRTLPAFAIGADLALPVGSLAAERTFASLKGVATRTFSFARLHANGQYTFGSAAEDDRGFQAGEASRWMAGMAIDRTLPLRSLLATADLFAEQPLYSDEPLEWTAEAGVRYQTSPQFNLDLGVGRRFTGGDKGWFFTFGLAHAFAVRSLVQGR